MKRQNFNFKILSITQESFGNTSLRMNCPQIKIETKFVQPKDLQKRLQQGGAKFLKEVHYSDTYFDNSSCSLTLQDHWLRRRDEAWELKIPAGGKSRGKEKGIDGYNEVTDECEIIQHLSRSLGLVRQRA